MMKHQLKTVLSLSLLSSILLSSCTLKKMIENYDDRRIEVTLSGNTMSDQKSFLDQIKVQVNYFGVSGESKDVTKDSYGYLLDSAGRKCGINDLVPSGKYTFVAEYPTYTDTYSAKSPVEVTKSESATATGNIEAVESDFSKYNIDNYAYMSALGPYNLPNHATDGVNPQVLVIPVYFRDDSKPNNSDLDSLKSAFFGTSGETGYESLSSYYEKASYGKLKIEGAVSQPIALGYTASEAEEKFKSDPTLPSKIVYNAYQQVYKNQNELFLKNHNFDSNKDGVVDGVEVIYFHETYMEDLKVYQEQLSRLEEEYMMSFGSKREELAKEIQELKEKIKNQSTFLWAYTSNINYQSEPKSLFPFRFFFASYYQIMNGYYRDSQGNTLPDSHTLIHENGHMLGLDDYYDYSQKSAPSGLANMMDFNIGDLDPYSKILLGFTTPTLVSGMSEDFTMDLSSFEDSGEVLLLKGAEKDDYNGSPYDTYLLLSYYTPTGLNYQDAMEGYPEWKEQGTGGMYKEFGLMVYLVDARAVNVTLDSSGNMVGPASFVTSPEAILKEPQETSSRIRISAVGQSNSIPGDDVTGAYSLTSSGKSDYRRLLTAIPADGSEKFLKENYQVQLGRQGTLFTSLPTLNSFTPRKFLSYFPDGRLPDGTKLGYSFRVVKTTEDKITLRFVKNS